MSYELFDIERQLKEWREKREALAAWMQTHTIDHPDFEPKFREQRNVMIKIDQLKRRREGFKGDVPKTYSLPKGQTNFK